MALERKGCKQEDTDSRRRRACWPPPLPVAEASIKTLSHLTTIYESILLVQNSRTIRSQGDIQPLLARKKNTDIGALAASKEWRKSQGKVGRTVDEQNIFFSRVPSIKSNSAPGKFLHLEGEARFRRHSCSDRLCGCTACLPRRPPHLHQQCFAQHSSC